MHTQKIVFRYQLPWCQREAPRQNTWSGASRCRSADCGRPPRKPVEKSSSAKMQVEEVDWKTIIFGTFIVRTCTTLPISTYLAVQRQRLTTSMPLLNLHASQNASKQKIRTVLAEVKYRPMSTIFLPLIQIPVFVSMSLYIRQLCTEPRNSGAERTEWWARVYQNLKRGGFGPWPDLTIPPSEPVATATSLFFPLLICSTHLINLVSFNQQTAQQDHLKQLFSSRQPNQSRVSGRAVMKGLMTLMTLLSLPVSLKMPMALNVYWFSSALFSLAQTRILQSSRFLKYLRR